MNSANINYSFDGVRLCLDSFLKCYTLARRDGVRWFEEDADGLDWYYFNDFFSCSI